MAYIFKGRFRPLCAAALHRAFPIPGSVHPETARLWRAAYNLALRGRRSMAGPELPKLKTWVRFPSPAPVVFTLAFLSVHQPFSHSASQQPPCAETLLCQGAEKMFLQCLSTLAPLAGFLLRCTVCGPFIFQPDGMARTALAFLCFFGS